MDVLCQAKSGMGKTAVFVLATLQQLEPVDGEVSTVILCHTRELAYQIRNEFSRFSKYMPNVRTAVFYGGTPVKADQEVLADKEKCPHIVVGTPGRINGLVRDKSLKVEKSVKHFVLDECDKMLEALGQSFFSHAPTGLFFLDLRRFMEPRSGARRPPKTATAGRARQQAAWACWCRRPWEASLGCPSDQAASVPPRRSVLCKGDWGARLRCSHIVAASIGLFVPDRFRYNTVPRKDTYIVCSLLAFRPPSGAFPYIHPTQTCAAMSRRSSARPRTRSRS